MTHGLTSLRTVTWLHCHYPTVSAATIKFVCQKLICPIGNIDIPHEVNVIVMVMLSSLSSSTVITLQYDTHWQRMWVSCKKVKKKRGWGERNEEFYNSIASHVERGGSYYSVGQIEESLKVTICDLTNSKCTSSRWRIVREEASCSPSPNSIQNWNRV